ncbi:DUF5519 family protein [Paenibacillus aurantius]|uniref:DUF5519 family protein n=1 Tax=Paenibacillus aurantius TaxID=2918900 RepID=A0AA96RET2_9BACL|nr:luciferase family protein [Paenibacillus aurantius]WNQ11217.1 DUF5519 family protein [Paenibacillus aurantius]
MEGRAREIISEELSGWPGVTEGPHRFGGIEFQFEGKEIGHLHGDTLLDLPMRKAVRDELVGSGRAKPHHIYPDSGWVSFYLTSEGDAAAAIGLLRLKYEELVSAAKKREEG